MGAGPKILIGVYDTGSLDNYRKIFEEYVPDSFTIVDNGETLVNKFCEGDGVYAFVIATDIMPNISGIEAIKQMRKYESKENLTPAAMYLVMARVESRRVEEDAFKAGATGILRKPVQEDDLLEILDEYFKICESSSSA